MLAAVPGLRPIAVFEEKRADILISEPAFDGPWNGGSGRGGPGIIRLTGCVARTLDDDAKTEIRADPASRYAAISKRLATKAA